MDETTWSSGTLLLGEIPLIVGLLNLKPIAPKKIILSDRGWVD